MNDPRLARLAKLLVDYSLGLREGEVVRINSSDAAAPLVLALQRVALERGVHAYANVALEGLAEILVAEGSKAQREFVSELAYREVDRLDAEITIWSESNTKSFSRADPEARGQVYAAERSLVNRRWERIDRGEMRWVGTLMPTNAHAQDAEMSLREYEDFVFRACHVDGDEDPVAHWRASADELTARAGELTDTREIRIVGPDTDLRLGVAGRTWQPSYGTLQHARRRGLHQPRRDGDPGRDPLHAPGRLLRTRGRGHPASLRGRPRRRCRARGAAPTTCGRSSTPTRERASSASSRSG